jgi:cephalosporin-C deacetylase-like acetyl esterase
VVNFARLVKVPGFYSWGYNDTTCPPTSMFAAYNVIKAPKTLLIAEETGHWKYPEQNEASWIWIMQFLSK